MYDVIISSPTKEIASLDLDLHLLVGYKAFSV